MRYYPSSFEKYEEDGKTGFIGVLRFSETHSAIGSGATKEEAIADLESNLIGAVDFAIAKNEIFPEPLPPEKDEILVLMPTLVEAKMLIHNERLKRQLSKTDLGKLAGFSPAEMQRLLNPWYKSGIDKIDRLFRALGLTVSLNLS